MQPAEQWSCAVNRDSLMLHEPQCSVGDQALQVSPAGGNPCWMSWHQGPGAAGKVSAHLPGILGGASALVMLQEARCVLPHGYSFTQEMMGSCAVAMGSRA